MIILNSDHRTIELDVNKNINQTNDRKSYMIDMPEIICTSRTDAENIQNKINNFVFNLCYETLSLDKKLTQEQIRLSSKKEGDKNGN